MPKKVFFVSLLVLLIGCTPVIIDGRHLYDENEQPIPPAELTEQASIVEVVAQPTSASPIDIGEAPDMSDIGSIVSYTAAKVSAHQYADLAVMTADLLGTSDARSYGWVVEFGGFAIGVGVDDAQDTQEYGEMLEAALATSNPSCLGYRVIEYTYRNYPIQMTKLYVYFSGELAESATGIKPSSDIVVLVFARLKDYPTFQLTALGQVPDGSIDQNPTHEYIPMETCP